MTRSIQDCIADIARAGQLTGAAARQLLEQTEARAARLARERDMSPDEAVRQAAADMQDAQGAAAAIEKRNALLKWYGVAPCASGNGIKEVGFATTRRAGPQPVRPAPQSVLAGLEPATS